MGYEAKTYKSYPIVVLKNKGKIIGYHVPSLPSSFPIGFKSEEEAKAAIESRIQQLIEYIQNRLK
ncbi:MAG TPA: hypothetical protein VMG59_06945 [Phycisphaerae bacterium]|nr:hypothetical protein [Phycisphaerae bacterium]